LPVQQDEGKISGGLKEIDGIVNAILLMLIDG
jgi:hypothetical protein